VTADEWIERGAALYRTEELELARMCFLRAIELDSQCVAAYSNLGIVHRSCNRHEEAVRCFASAVKINPDYAQAHFHLALALLLLGDYEQGWFEYEWRKHLPSYLEKAPQLSCPEWTGQESLAGKTILLHGEQGFGDTIQFCRFAKQVADLGANVILGAHRDLRPALLGLEGVALFHEDETPLPHLDFHCSLMSLPLALKTCINNIPFARGYLRSDADVKEKWRKRLGVWHGRRIGLVWNGKTQRSLSAKALLEKLPQDCQYVCLQKNITQEDRVASHLQPNLIFVGDDLHDFADTAALCDLMDLVISVDTSVVHLAGALGTPTWLLLSSFVDWRWLLEREDSPWYASVRVWRQDEATGWEGLLRNMSLACA
jgi:hypothetical protein